jgi:prevent-host-death family protein
MKRIPLSEVKDDLSRYLRMARKDAVVITRHGRPAGVLVGFSGEEDWFDYLLENDPRFVRRIDAARASLKAGRGVRLEDALPRDDGKRARRKKISARRRVRRTA